MPSPESVSSTIAFHAVEERRSHGVETLLRKSICHRTHMLVDSEDLLYHHQSSPGFAMWFGYIGIQLVPIAGLQLHYSAHSVSSAAHDWKRGFLLLRC